MGNLHCEEKSLSNSFERFGDVIKSIARKRSFTSCNGCFRKKIRLEILNRAAWVSRLSPHDLLMIVQELFGVSSEVKKENYFLTGC